MILNDVLVKGAQDGLGAFFTDGGEMGVDDGLIERSVTEVGGDVSDTDTVFEQVSGITMTQGVDSDALGDARCGDGPFESILDGGATHGLLRCVHGFLSHAFLC